MVFNCRSASSDSRKIVKWNVEDTITWLRKQGSPSYEDYLVSASVLNVVSYLTVVHKLTYLVVYIVGVEVVFLIMFVFWVTFQERLAHLKRQCQPHLTETAKSSVEGICSKMYNISCESVRKIHEFHWQLLKEHGIKGQ